MPSHSMKFLSVTALLAFAVLKGGIKNVVLLTMLLNMKSLPLAYHLNVFMQMIKLRFTAKRITPTTKSGDNNKLTTVSVWSVQSTISERVLFDDLDINIHMNNASYYKQLDFARLDYLSHFSGLSQNFLGQKYKIGNAGVVVFFKRELKPFQSYSIETTLLTYEEKWFFLIHKFVSSEGLHAIGISKLVFKELTGKTLKFPDAMELWGYTDTENGKREERFEFVQGLLDVEEGAFALSKL